MSYFNLNVAIGLSMQSEEPSVTYDIPETPSTRAETESKMVLEDQEAITEEPLSRRNNYHF